MYAGMGPVLSKIHRMPPISQIETHLHDWLTITCEQLWAACGCQLALDENVPPLMWDRAEKLARGMRAHLHFHALPRRVPVEDPFFQRFQSLLCEIDTARLRREHSTDVARWQAAGEQFGRRLATASRRWNFGCSHCVPELFGLQGSVLDAWVAPSHPSLFRYLGRGLPNRPAWADQPRKILKPTGTKYAPPRASFIRAYHLGLFAFNAVLAAANINHGVPMDIVNNEDFESTARQWLGRRFSLYQWEGCERLEVLRVNCAAQGLRLIQLHTDASFHCPSLPLDSSRLSAPFRHDLEEGFDCVYAYLLRVPVIGKIMDHATHWLNVYSATKIMCRRVF